MRHAPLASIVVLATALGTACAPAVSLPSPCASNDIIYNMPPADTSRGLQRAYPTHIHPPSPEFRGRAIVRLVVDARGHVLADSTRVENATRENATLLKRSVADYRFRPATLGSCAVSSWFVLSFSTP